MKRGRTSDSGPGVRRGDQSVGRTGVTSRSSDRPSNQLSRRLELNLREPERLSNILKK